MEEITYPSTKTIFKTAVVAILLMVAALFGFGCGQSAGTQVAVSPDPQEFEFLNRSSSNTQDHSQGNSEEHRGYNDNQQGHNGNRDNNWEWDQDEGREFGEDREFALNLDIKKLMEGLIPEISAAEFEALAQEAYDKAYALYVEYNMIVFGTEEGPGTSYVAYGEVEQLPKKTALEVELKYKRAEKEMQVAAMSALLVKVSTPEDSATVNASLKLLYRLQGIMIHEYVYHVKRYLPTRGQETTIYDFTDKVNEKYAKAKELHTEALAMLEASGGTPTPEELEQIKTDYLQAIGVGMWMLYKLDAVDVMEEWYDWYYLKSTLYANSWVRKMCYEYVTQVKPL